MPRPQLSNCHYQSVKVKPCKQVTFRAEPCSCSSHQPISSSCGPYLYRDIIVIFFVFSSKIGVVKFGDCHWQTMLGQHPHISSCSGIEPELVHQYLGDEERERDSCFAFLDTTQTLLAHQCFSCVPVSQPCSELKLAQSPTVPKPHLNSSAQPCLTPSIRYKFMSSVHTSGFFSFLQTQQEKQICDVCDVCINVNVKLAV